MIEVKNLDFKYAGQKQPVFQGFNLQLSENHIYGLLGKNGTGKSTLLYLISGLMRPNNGKVRVDDVDSYLRNPDMLKEIFLVPEEFDMPAVTLEEYVKIHQPFYPRFSREVLKGCLEDFEMTESIKLDALSMGQKKKAFMCFALATGTRLLLMDEPTNGLDIPSKAQFRRAVAHYMTDDRIMIISTHQVHDVESLLDHILILSQNKLLCDSSVSEILSHYQFDYRMPSEMSDDVVYAEPTLQGNAVMTRRPDGAEETQLNLELFFNAVTQNKINNI